MSDIWLQPKQEKLLDLVENHRAVNIGVGGGRGAAKSGGADRVALVLMAERPGVVGCIVMRNFDQVRKYHMETILRDFPELERFFKKTDAKLKIPAGGTYSELDFSYAESLEDVKRRFRSGNYGFIIVDQAEQFTWEELSEMALAARARGGKVAKMIYLFNMGGIGIQDLRNRFGPQKKYNENEDAADYVFLHVFPQDNVEWARSELESDGLTTADYYAWTDEERFTYFTTRTAYGRKLNALDDATRARDLLGSWESLEGAYFGRVFDYKATMKSAEVAEGILKPWDMRWLSTDWGKTHYCSTHWHGKTLLTPFEVFQAFGWVVPRPLTVISTYRRLIVNENTSVEVARKIVELTPLTEREKIKRYPFSPEQFGERDSEETVPILVGRELRKFGMAQPELADNSRKPGWQLMYTLLNNTRIWATKPGERTEEMEAEAGDTVWIISSECPEALETIPVLMRNVKDLDDVVKTDKGQAVLAMDVADDLRYGVQTVVGLGRKPFAVAMQERVSEAFKQSGPTAAHIVHLKMQEKQKSKQVYRRNG